MAEKEAPAAIFIAKAARQLGFSSAKEVMERARMLEDREAQGLPTEPTPSGRFTDSHDEVDDPIAFRVGIDRQRKVIAIHHGRPLMAFDIHPAAARALAMTLMNAADMVDPDGSLIHSEPVLVGVAYVHAEDGKVREAQLEFNADPTSIPELKDDDE